MSKNYDSHDNDKSSLSDMINEYDTDNALRNKIEAIKKQKEQEEEARKQAEIQLRLNEIEKSKQAQSKKDSVESKVNTDETTEIPPMANAKPFINADADITQVFSADAVKPEDDADKTLVIMENRKQRNFSEYEQPNDDTQPMPETANSEEIERLAPEFEVNDEKITEEDIEEYLPQDSKKAKKPKKPNNPDKMNKTITYVIAGIAGLCVIGLLVFGLNLLGVFGGSDDNKTLKLDEVVLNEENKEEIGANNFSIKGSEVEKITDSALISLAKAEAKNTEEGTKVQITTVDKSELKAEKGTYKVTFSTKKGTKVTVKATVSESAKEEEDKKDNDNTVDNSTKINELEGQIRINQDQIARLQNDNVQLQNTINAGPEEVAKIDNGYAERLQKANTDYANAETAYNNAKEAYIAAKGTAGEAAAQDALNKAKTSYDTANSALSSLNSEISQKKSDIQTNISAAQSQLDQNNQSIITLQNEVIDLQNQLNQLKG